MGGGGGGGGWGGGGGVRVCYHCGTMIPTCMLEVNNKMIFSPNDCLKIPVLFLYPKYDPDLYQNVITGSFQLPGSNHINAFHAYQLL